MSSCIFIPSSASLISSVADKIEARDNDYSRTLVVFPGKRPKHFLLKELALRVQQTIIPPVVLDVDHFIEYCHRDLMGNESNDFSEMDAAAVLFELHLKNKRPFGKSEFNALDRFLPLATKMFAEMEELKIACVDRNSVRVAVSQLPVPELHEVGALYESFYDVIEGRGAVTRAMRYASVAENIGRIELPYEKVILAGFHGLTKSEERIFQSVLHKANVEFVFQHGAGMEKTMQSLGLSYAAPDESDLKADVRLYPCPDTHSQVFGMNRILSGLLESDRQVNENTVIVLPIAESLFPVIHHTLPLFPEDSTNISIGYPILRTPLNSFLTSLADAVASRLDHRFHAPEYLNFVLHPYTKNITFGQRADVTRILFHTIEERFFAGAARMFFTLEELEHDESIVTHVADRLSRMDHAPTAEELRTHLRSIHSKTLRAFDSVKTLGAFASRVIDLLEYITDHSTAQRHPYFRRFADEFMRKVSSLSTSLLAPHSFERLESYFQFLKHVLSSSTLPFPGTPLRGLQVLGPLETRSLRFKHVFILDANDDLFLPRRKVDMLLPLSVRRQLGLPTYIDENQWQNYTFDVLLRGAEEVHLFYANEDGKTPSSVVEKLLWEKQKRDEQSDVGPYLTPVHHEVSLINTSPGAIRKTPEIIERLRSMKHSASRLDTYLNCQIQFYYGTVLGLSEREEVSGELEGRHIGTFIHEVLRAFHEPHRERELIAADLKQKAMDSVVDDVFEKTFGAQAIGASFLLKQQVRERMHEYLDYQSDVIRSERVTILDLEQKFEGSVNGFNIKGTIDRIEERTRRDGSGESRLIISDYKTGGKQSVKEAKFEDIDPDDRSTWNAIGSVQLGMYELLSEQNPRSMFSSAYPQYIWLADKHFGEGSEIPLYKSEEEREAYRPKLQALLGDLLSDIHNTGIPFTPPENLKDACRFCAFTSICGTDWVVK